MNFTDKERLLAARGLALLETEGCGIGTLGEKLIHKTLKYFISESRENHEQKLRGAVADVVLEGRIYEIQTRALSRLVPKLSHFLTEYPVTVIYPLVTELNIVWLSPDSGEMSEPKKSSKRQVTASALYEISSLFQLLDNTELTVELLILRATEYRLSDGYGSLGHKRATKLNIQPDEIYEQITIKSMADIAKLLPTDLPQAFTAKEFYKSVKLRDRQGYYALKALEKYGLLSAAEKRGNAIIYTAKNTVQKSE